MIGLAGTGFKQILRGMKSRLIGPKEYKGEPEEICSKAIEASWDGKYFRGSGGHYSQFWLRDFGMCSESLCELGHEEKVKKTLEKALEAFERKGKITTTIVFPDTPFNLGPYCPDSLAWLMKAINVSGYDFSAHRKLLGKEVQRFSEKTLDESGLVRTDTELGALKGGYEDKGLLYNQVMAAMLSDHLDETDLKNPLNSFDFPGIIEENFWNGESFENDLETGKVTGDANLFPYWTEVIEDENKKNSSLEKIQEKGLDQPFPLVYESGETSYQVNTAWTQIGAAWIDLFKEKEVFDTYKEKYFDWINEFGNYLECFTRGGRPFTKLIYYSDESMLWASIFLNAVKKA